VKLETETTRGAFESWIAPELEQIERGLASLLHKTGIAPNDVDAVFLTGGSSLVPAVRRIFEAAFGTEKLRSGDEFTSVARGLALSASG
jgi:hypothetical chaperone protein